MCFYIMDQGKRAGREQGDRTSSIRPAKGGDAHPAGGGLGTEAWGPRLESFLTLPKKLSGREPGQVTECLSHREGGYSMQRPPFYGEPHPHTKLPTSYPRVVPTLGMTPGTKCGRSVLHRQGTFVALMVDVGISIFSENTLFGFVLFSKD